MRTDVIRVTAGSIAQVWRDATLAEVDPDGADSSLREVEAGKTCFGMLWSDDDGARLPDPPAALKARWLKAECSRRILAVLSESTQKNFTSYGADLALTAATSGLSAEQVADAATLRAARGWVDAMLAACRNAIASGAEPVWPPVPAGVAAMATRF